MNWLLIPLIVSTTLLLATALVIGYLIYWKPRMNNTNNTNNLKAMHTSGGHVDTDGDDADDIGDPSIEIAGVSGVNA